MKKMPNGQTLLQPLNDNWNYQPDNEVAELFSKDLESRFNCPGDIDATLCGRCARLELWSPRCNFHDTLEGLRANCETCKLCRLLHSCISSHLIASDMKLEFSRIGSSLACGAITGSLIASFYTLPRFSSALPTFNIGIPELPTPGSAFNSALVREWIRSCDENHDCMPKDDSFFPTRVLDVATENSGHFHLITVSSGIPSGGRYLALSHRWGPPATNAMFRTLRNNLAELQKATSVSNLPETFQHAIQITQRLNIRYLWIDSLCIIQDDPEDWDRESRLMERVFSSAYATIAATCASGTGSGFLKARPERNFVTLRKGSASYFVCEAIDNFREDVDQADLNQRGWVLQERALSRRTIHFTSRQCYWECGAGVRCETLTRMTKFVPLYRAILILLLTELQPKSIVFRRCQLPTFCRSVCQRHEDRAFPKLVFNLF